MNRWTAFLKYHSGQGLTKQELSNKYRILYDIAPLSRCIGLPQINCKDDCKWVKSSKPHKQRSKNVVKKAYCRSIPKL